MGLLERFERWTFDNPIRSSVVLFGGLAVFDAVVLGPSWFTAVVVGIGLFQLWGHRRPDGHLRRRLKQKYGWEEPEAPRL